MAENKNVRPPMGGMRHGAGRVVEKPKDFKGTTKKLLKNYLAKYKIPIIIVICCWKYNIFNYWTKDFR